jgi:hypothetical protein
MDVKEVGQIGKAGCMRMTMTEQIWIYRSPTGLKKAG